MNPIYKIAIVIAIYGGVVALGVSCTLDAALKQIEINQQR